MQKTITLGLELFFLILYYLKNFLIFLKYLLKTRILGDIMEKIAYII